MRKIFTIPSITGMFIFILFILVLSSFNAKGGTINVPEDYSTIQAAIDNANETDNTIYIHSGTYYENIVINKTLTMYGNSKDDTFIYPSDASSDVIKISSTDNVEISKLTITVAEISDKSGLIISESNQCTISQCNISKFDSGIFIDGSNDNSITNNIIKECEGAGIMFSHSSNNIITNNEIKNNGKGIYIPPFSSSNNNNFYYNDFYYNGPNNNRNAYDGGTNNNWDDGSEGNKWSDYTGFDSGNGIGTISYTIPDNGVDHYPTGYFVNQEPTAYIVSILPSSPEEGDTIHLKGDGSDDGYIVKFEWKIDGISTEYGENVDITGLSIGTHTAKLRVKDNEDTWSSWTETQSFTIQPKEDEEEENQKPIATIGLPDSSSITKKYGETITFLGSGTDTDGEIDAYKWEENNEVLSYEKYFYRSNLSVGTHTIYFKVKDDTDEWSDPDEVIIEITQNNSMDNRAPTPVMNGPYSSYVNQSISFDASDSIDDGTIISYKWNFGDGNKGSGKTVTHSYQNTGEYTIVLTVTDNNELSSQISSIANIQSSTNDNNSNEDDQNSEGNNKNKDDGKIVIPGFEITILISSLISLIVILNKKKEK